MASNATDEEAPERGFASVSGRGTGPLRSRKETLSSPIPALLAASMGDVEEVPTDPDSIPVLVQGAETARLDPSVAQVLLVKTNPPETHPDADRDRYWVEMDS